MKHSCKLCGKEGFLSFTEIYCSTKDCRNYRKDIAEKLNSNLDLNLEIEELEKQISFYPWD